MDTAEQAMIDRLRLATSGAARARVIRGWLACLGERVRPASPALSHWSRGRWEELRIAELMEQLEELRDRREGLEGP
jgi:hypothetical protein